MPSKFDISQLEEFRDKLEKLNSDLFLKSCVLELGARLLTKVKKRTPVGIYPKESGKVGGTLRRNWYADPNVSVKGKEYSVTIYNNTSYAPYVEYGHRQEVGRFVPTLGKRLKNAWVNGRFMLTESENELRSQTDAILVAKLEKALKDLVKND